MVLLITMVVVTKNQNTDYINWIDNIICVIIAVRREVYEKARIKR